MMKFDEATLKAQSLLRRAGLADVPRAVIVCVLVLAVALVLVAAWHFWPRPTQSFSVSPASSAALASSGVGSVTSSSSAAGKQIVVDVEGAVVSPGLYTFDKGMRVGDAIKAAGGFSPDAVSGATNLARELADGEQVLVPRVGDSGDQTASPTSAGGTQSANAKININTASAEDLQKLSGIGPSLSERIVEYRKANGRFTKIEDLQNVSGIGETRFASIKDKVCV